MTLLYGDNTGGITRVLISKKIWRYKEQQLLLKEPRLMNIMGEYIEFMFEHLSSAKLARDD